MTESARRGTGAVERFVERVSAAFLWIGCFPDTHERHPCRWSVLIAAAVLLNPWVRAQSSAPLSGFLSSQLQHPSRDATSGRTTLYAASLAWNPCRRDLHDSVALSLIWKVDGNRRTRDTGRSESLFRLDIKVDSTPSWVGRHSKLGSGRR